jgi:uncharacterized protein
MSRRRHPAASATTAAAMSLAELERWLRDRAARRPVATSMPTLDGYVAAIVAGPVSISPLDWICPLLAIDADAFNHGGTAEFAAISALQHHNAISNTLSSNPKRFEPIHRRKPNGDVDARPWCLGFHAAMQPRLSAWAQLLDTRNRASAACENCGCATVKIGKLSRIGLHPLINVYKCQPCRKIISITSHF